MQNSAPQSRQKFAWVFLLCVLALNLFALGLAWRAKSFDALAFVYSPIGNGLLALFAFAFFLQRRPGFSMARHLALSLGVPAVAAIIDYIVAIFMYLHGC